MSRKTQLILLALEELKNASYSVERREECEELIWKIEMSDWISVDVQRPNENQQVLLYWKHSGHIEDGAFYRDEDTGSWYHCLFDGEALNEQPSHWMPLPESPND